VERWVSAVLGVAETRELLVVVLAVLALPTQAAVVVLVLHLHLVRILLAQLVVQVS
jgi:hypothetical protein